MRPAIWSSHGNLKLMPAPATRWNLPIRWTTTASAVLTWKNPLRIVPSKKIATITAIINSTVGMVSTIVLPTRYSVSLETKLNGSRPRTYFCACSSGGMGLMRFSASQETDEIHQRLPAK